jgi:phosphoenolpyruvate carboxylase
MKAVKLLKKWPRGKAIPIDEKRAKALIDKLSEAYKKNLMELAPLINRMALYIPNRRRRKLHIGLFGYSRNVGELQLPRAIRFCAALYSIGIPPEILGMEALDEKDYRFLEQIYPNMAQDLSDALSFLNRDNLQYLNNETARSFTRVADRFNAPVNERHCFYTTQILEELRSNRIVNLPDMVVTAASLRGFLG